MRGTGAAAALQAGRQRAAKVARGGTAQSSRLRPGIWCQEPFRITRFRRDEWRLPETVPDTILCMSRRSPARRPARQDAKGLLERFAFPHSALGACSGCAFSMIELAS